MDMKSEQEMWSDILMLLGLITIQNVGWPDLVMELWLCLMTSHLTGKDWTWWGGLGGRGSLTPPSPTSAVAIGKTIE